MDKFWNLYVKHQNSEDWIYKARIKNGIITMEHPKDGYYKYDITTDIKNEYGIKKESFANNEIESICQLMIKHDDDNKDYILHDCKDILVRSYILSFKSSTDYFALLQANNPNNKT